MLADFDGFAIIGTTKGGRVSMKNVTFAGNTVSIRELSGSTEPDAQAGAHIVAQAIHCPPPGEDLILDEDTLVDTIVQLQGCTFDGNTSMPTFLRQTHPNVTAAIFHDIPDVIGLSTAYPGLSGNRTVMSSLDQYSGEALEQEPQFPLLPTGGDQWIIDTREVVYKLQPALHPVHQRIVAFR